MVRFRADDDAGLDAVSPDAIAAINKLALAVARFGVKSPASGGNKQVGALFGGRKKTRHVSVLIHALVPFCFFVNIVFYARQGSGRSAPRRHKATVAVYGGQLTATAYAAFAGAEYRLGTAVTALSLPEVGVEGGGWGGEGEGCGRGEREG